MKPDFSLIPKIITTEGTWGDISIVKSGSYLDLIHSGEQWHSLNTKNKREIYEQYSSYDLAYGDVLVSGFGFGYTTLWIASKPEVKSVTVIEVSQDVVDAFLANNQLPENVSVIIEDINLYKSNKKYDCIFFDHFNYLKEDNFYKELCNNAKKIPHNLFWFWSLELYYIMNYYGITKEQLFLYPIDFKQFDFTAKWNEFRGKLDMPSIPLIPKSKLDLYIDVYFMRHLLPQEADFPKDKYPH